MQRLLWMFPHPWFRKTPAPVVLDIYDKYYSYYGYDYWDIYGTIYMISSSDGRWHVTLIDDRQAYYGRSRGLEGLGYDVFHDLTIDAAGRLYMAEGTASCCYSYGWGYAGAVIELIAPFQERNLVGFGGDNFGNLKVGASGHLYGTTAACGSSEGTVWKLTP